MNISTEYQAEENACKDFLERVQITYSILNLLKKGGTLYFLILPVTWFESLRDYGRTKKLVKKIRDVTNNCKENCKETHCLDTFYIISKEIRDNYLNILDYISQNKVLSFFFGAITESSLYDWDELVEDCVVGSDKEFKELILKIAENA